MSDKREDYISWDEYFMGVAMLSGMRSKDPNTQVGACIVSPDHKILSMGYNGFPSGCSDDEFPWAREGEPLDNKYFYTTHSELNAITVAAVWRVLRYMFHFFRVTNVQKPSSSPGSAISSTMKINTKTHRESLRLRGC